MNNNTAEETVNTKPKYALFLDDVRKPLGGLMFDDGIAWVIVRSYDAFVKHITENGLPCYVTFDHDLAFEHYPISEKDGGISNPRTIPYDKYVEKTGYDCAKWLVDYCLKNKLPLPKWNVHSMNPVGADNIRIFLRRFEKLMI